MAIDSFTDEGAINIKDITTPETRARKTVPFNPRKDIPAENLNGIMLDYNKYANLALSPDYSLLEYLDFGGALNLMFTVKNRDQSTQNTLENKSLKFIENNWTKEIQNPVETLIFSRNLIDVAILFPDIPKEKLMNQEQKEIMKTKAQEAVNKAIATPDHTSSYQAMEILANLKRFDLQLLGEFEHVDKIAEWAQTYCEQKLSKFDQVDGYNEHTEDFLESATQLKILSPEKFKKLKITETHWDNMKAYLNEELMNDNDQNTWMYYTKGAMQLSVVAASDIKFQNGSIKLSFDDPKPNVDFNTNTPPVTRKF